METCLREKLQYLQGTTSCKGTTMLGEGVWPIILFPQVGRSGGNKSKDLVKNWKMGNWPFFSDNYKREGNCQVSSKSNPNFSLNDPLLSIKFESGL